VSELPPDVIEWVGSVFAARNRQSTESLTMTPNIQEEWLDHTWVDELARFSSPQVLSSNWVVRIDAHFLGGMRHFSRWEIADIGVLVKMRLGPSLRKSKLVLLQSKRLYPDGAPVRVETLSDHHLGGRAAPLILAAEAVLVKTSTPGLAEPERFMDRPGENPSQGNDRSQTGSRGANDSYSLQVQSTI
jgi:hypothetical protein